MQVKEHLNELGAYFFMPVQMGYGATTIDFLCCIKGRFIGIETKAPKKKATPLQKIVMRRINAAGGYAFEADSIEVVKHMLDYITKDLPEAPVVLLGAQ